MSHHEIEIEKLAFGGAGFGRCGGKACFVPFTAPGDVVLMEVTAEKKSFLTGKMKRLIKPSPMRTMPPCPVFGECGGCQLQHLTYDAQLAQKQEIFSELMARIGRVDPGTVEPILASPLPFEYRSRIQLKVRFAGGKVHFGFYRTGTHFVIQVPGVCAVADSCVNALIGQLDAFMARFPEPDKIPQIDVSTGGTGEALLVFHYIGHDPARISTFIDRHRGDLSAAGGIWLQFGRKSTLTRVTGSDSLAYTVSGANGAPLALSFSRGGFSQVNMAQNRALVSMVQEWARLSGDERVLDLYCGNGNFSLPLAGSVGTVLGIEDYAPSIEDARTNAAANGIGNVEYLCADAAGEIRRRGAEGERVDLVIIDPPRTGAKEVVESVHSLRPPSIIYISCDPPTLARDCAILRKHGYEVVRSRPVDMFPQTYHLESITLLQAVY